MRPCICAGRGLNTFRPFSAMFGNPKYKCRGKPFIVGHFRPFSAGRVRTPDQAPGHHTQQPKVAGSKPRGTLCPSVHFGTRRYSVVFGVSKSSVQNKSCFVFIRCFRYNDFGLRGSAQQAPYVTPSQKLQGVTGRLRASQGASGRPRVGMAAPATFGAPQIASHLKCLVSFVKS